MMFLVVEQHRTLMRGDTAFVPQCPATGCREVATHDVKRGPKWVSRGCLRHAEALCALLNDDVDMGSALDALG